METTNSSFRKPKAGRHLAEKQRRQNMKGLYRQLASLVSGKNCLEKSPGLDLLDQATNYIKQLEKNINELKSRMDSLQLPVEIAVNESDTVETLLEINVVCGSENKNMKMHKVFRILEEEGAEVVSASISTVGLNIYHTILCKAILPRLGMDTIMVQQRLQTFTSADNINL